MSYLAALSSTFFTHAERLSFALAAAFSYRLLRSGLTRKPSHADSPLFIRGLPLGRFGCSIGLIMYQQIIIDNPS